MQTKFHDCFYTITLYFNIFIHGNSGYLFPKHWKWKICHTQQAIILPLSTFSGKLRTFSTVKSKTVGFLLDLAQQYTPVLFAKTPRQEKELLSSHYAAYSEVAACDSIMNALKIAGSAWQNV